MINITKNQFLQFIRTKKDTDEKLTKATQHYLDYYDKYISTGKKGNWNFAAFLPAWFWYRRMYTQGLLIFIFTRLTEKIEAGITDKIMHYYPHLVHADVEKNVAWTSMAIWLIFAILCVRYADYIYLVFASEQISRGTTTSGVNRGIIIFFMVIIVLSLACLTCLTLHQ